MSEQADLTALVEKLVQMNKYTCDAVINLISKRPDLRSRKEVELVLPIISWRTNCLRRVDKDAAIEILKKSAYLRCKRDFVIIRQGAIGDAFYIIIRGAVSVYRNDALENRSNDVIGDSTPKESVKSSTSKPKSERRVRLPRLESKDMEDKSDQTLNRKQFGTRVNILGAGRSFGEMALIYGDTVRNASIIADEPTHLLVISRDLFNSTVKDYQELDIEERKAFVAVHPYFCKWTEQDQKQLLMSLVRTIYPIGSPIIKQGEQITSLKFILKGRARISAEPAKHEKQYPELFAWYRMGQLEEDIWKHLGDQKKMRIPACSSLFTEETHVRRSKGYVGAERRFHGKNIEISFVEGGEVLNDIELILGLDTNIYKVVCSSECEVYSLDAKIFHNLIAKKHRHSLQMMKIAAQTKLYSRLNTPPGQKIELLHVLSSRLRHYRIPKERTETESEVNVVTLPPLLPALNSDSRKDRVMRMNREATLDWFKKDKAPYLKPFTIGPIFYKELMHKRAKGRELRKKRTPLEVGHFNTKRQVSDAIVAGIKEGIRTENALKKVIFQSQLHDLNARWK